MNVDKGHVSFTNDGENKQKVTENLLSIEIIESTSLTAFAGFFGVGAAPV